MAPSFASWQAALETTSPCFLEGESDAGDAQVERGLRLAWAESRDLKSGVTSFIYRVEQAENNSLAQRSSCYTCCGPGGGGGEGRGGVGGGAFPTHVNRYELVALPVQKSRSLPSVPSGSPFLLAYCMRVKSASSRSSPHLAFLTAKQLLPEEQASNNQSDLSAVLAQGEEREGVRGGVVPLSDFLV